MDIVKIIKSNEKLSELPFLIVFRTMKILEEMGILKEGDSDVDRVQP